MSWLTIEDPDTDLPDRHHFHYLSGPPGSFVLVSPNPSVHTAVVFVHGFNGDALGTWARFELLIDDHPEFKDVYAGADLFFLQYESVWQSIHTSANSFHDFIRLVVCDDQAKAFAVDIGPVTPVVDNSTDEEAIQSDITPHLVSALPAQREYRNLVLVAHSEGGVVVRQAIADCYPLHKTSPLFDSRLALFAPALFGYSPTGLLGTVFNMPGIGRVIDAFLRASPAYRDLQPKDKTDNLKPLREKTESLQEVASGFCAAILWGDNEGIVKDGKYERDTSVTISGTHTDICKPTRHFDKPLSFVVDRIKGR